MDKKKPVISKTLLFLGLGGTCGELRPEEPRGGDQDPRVQHGVRRTLSEAESAQYHPVRPTSHPGVFQSPEKEGQRNAEVTPYRSR